MRGMLRKDFYLMKEYRKIVLIIVFFSVLFCFQMKEGSEAFIMGYATLLMSMAVTTVIAYDQENNGMAYLLSLPVSRAGYVREKYLFGLLAGGCGWIGGIVVTATAELLRGRNPLRTDFLGIIFGFWAFLFLCQAVMIPIQLKFGEQKGRMIIILAMMVLIILGIGGASLLIESKIVTEEFVSWLLKSGLLPLIGAVLVLILYGISYGCSVRILNKKEF